RGGARLLDPRRATCDNEHLLPPPGEGMTTRPGRARSSAAEASSRDHPWFGAAIASTLTTQPCTLPRSDLTMQTRRCGLWLIGACGGVGSTVALGLAALARGLTDTTSLVTALPLFSAVDLDAPDQFVVGGHEIRTAGFRRTIRELHQRSGVFDEAVLAGCDEQ